MLVPVLLPAFLLALPALLVARAQTELKIATWPGRRQR